MVLPIVIRQGGVETAQVVELIRTHQEHCEADTIAGKCNRMDVTQYLEPEVRFWSAWRGGEAVGMVALKRLNQISAELKSMHVRTNERGKGIADQLLDVTIDYARKNGITELFLETGDTPAFVAARAFYERRDFTYCDPFGNYTVDNAGLCMRRKLA